MTLYLDLTAADHLILGLRSGKIRAMKTVALRPFRHDGVLRALEAFLQQNANLETSVAGDRERSRPVFDLAYFCDHRESFSLVSWLSAVYSAGSTRVSEKEPWVSGCS